MSQRPSLLALIGTRPEAIKLAPVIAALRESDRINVRVCFVAQHRDLLDQMAATFELKPDMDLNLMTEGLTPLEFTARALAEFARLMHAEKPSGMIAQGDTSTVFAAAIASYLNRCPFFHVEAGLRSGDLENPFPEEYHRRVASLGATLHFAPTSRARSHLLSEGVAGSRIYTVGNTVVDTLVHLKDRITKNDATYRRSFPDLDAKRMVLITAHRRENFGGPLQDICKAVRALCARYRDHVFVWSMHPNPAVKATVEQMLCNEPNVRLIPPVAYDELLWLLQACHLVLTDSGGIQEEAPSFGKPVLVLRTTTERPEGVEAGAAMLVGTDPDRIEAEASRLLSDPEWYRTMVVAENPYGDGKASIRIRDAIHAYFQVR